MDETRRAASSAITPTGTFSRIFSEVSAWCAISSADRSRSRMEIARRAVTRKYVASVTTASTIVPPNANVRRMIARSCARRNAVELTTAMCQCASTPVSIGANAATPSGVDERSMEELGSPSIHVPVAPARTRRTRPANSSAFGSSACASGRARRISAGPSPSVRTKDAVAPPTPTRSRSNWRRRFTSSTTASERPLRWIGAANARYHGASAPPSGGDTTLCPRRIASPAVRESSAVNAAVPSGGGVTASSATVRWRPSPS